jgi:hypothetical protein
MNFQWSRPPKLWTLPKVPLERPSLPLLVSWCRGPRQQPHKAAISHARMPLPCRSRAWPSAWGKGAQPNWPHPRAALDIIWPPSRSPCQSRLKQTGGSPQGAIPILSVPGKRLPSAHQVLLGKLRNTGSSTFCSKLARTKVLMGESGSGGELGTRTFSGS